MSKPSWKKKDLDSETLAVASAFESRNKKRVAKKVQTYRTWKSVNLENLNQIYEKILETFPDQTPPFDEFLQYLYLSVRNNFNPEKFT